MEPSNSALTPAPRLSRGWVPQPNSRRTLDIFQSCLATIVLCTWSVLLLNVPAENEGPWEMLKAKARWMMFTIFFSEVLTGVATEQWRLSAQRLII